MHAVALLVAPFYFSWRNALIALTVWSLTHCFGITLGYHRLLTHRSFKTPIWFEYMCAWLGSQSGQGDPIEWVSNHRTHHLHTDTPLDPHTPYEGFWFSHMGWFSDKKVRAAAAGVINRQGSETSSSACRSSSPHEQQTRPAAETGAALLSHPILAVTTAAAAGASWEQ
jgi:stearoyl-CoA desaturase (delta-9 desaturase)